MKHLKEINLAVVDITVEFGGRFIPYASIKIALAAQCELVTDLRCIKECGAVVIVQIRLVQ